MDSTGVDPQANSNPVVTTPQRGYRPTVLPFGVYYTTDRVPRAGALGCGVVLVRVTLRIE